LRSSTPKAGLVELSLRVNNADFSNTLGDGIFLGHEISSTLSDKIYFSSLKYILGDDILRHHSLIPSPTKILSGAYFLYTLGDEICFRHPISSTLSDEIFVSSLRQIMDDDVFWSP
jgi:hypothetical protein